MAHRRPKTLADQFTDLDDPAPKDFDPEQDPPESEGSDGSSGSEDENPEAAREHYFSVGKSKLRKPEQVPLGPQYAGSKISRNGISNDDDEDDPFSKGFDEEESDEDPGTDVVEQDELEDEEEGGEDPEASDDDGEAEEDEAMDDAEDTPASDLDDEDEDDSDDDEPRVANRVTDETRKEVLGLLNGQQKSVTSNLSQAAKEEAEKGRAVKKQRNRFDALLHTRIKLQKALIGTNTLAGLAKPDSTGPEVESEGSEAAFRAAETAAFNLWNSLTSLRDTLVSSRTGHKRKHAEFSVETPTSTLLSYTRSQDGASQPHTTAVLEKWAARNRATTAPTSSRNRLNPTANVETSVTDTLNARLMDTDRLVKRTRTPRSCAPYQLAHRVTEDESIYDDADWYGELLQSLLEQRSSEAVTSNIDFDVGVGHQGRREAKARKVVDTKASKGRKLRYTVHEKLQDFMAPEDRGTWGRRQTEELFGSLFGRRMMLDEDEADEGGKDQEDGHEEEEALMLFRS